MQYLKKRIMLFRCLYAPRHTAYKTKKIIFIWKYGGREYCSKSEKPPPAKRCFFCGLFNKRLGAVEFVLSYRFGRFLICSRLLGHWCRAPPLPICFPQKQIGGNRGAKLSQKRLCDKQNSPNIVYRFHNEIIEITLEDYLKENPDKTEHDFAELKALSDQIYYEQDRAESAQTRKDVSIHGLEETEHCATRALDEEWEERVVDIQNRKYAWKALEQLFTVGALTEVQKRRFRLHVFQGLSTRQIGRMEGTSHQAVAKSINLAIAKLKKYFAAQG